MSGSAVYAEWIAVDWGTSNLRAWAMRETAVVAEAASHDGMGKLGPAEFEPALISLIEPWLGSTKTPVIACGMVGARQGWKEAPYASVPCPPVGASITRPDVIDGRIDVTLLPGLSQQTPPDVMRGEETQIAGFLASMPAFDGVLCLPGTHTKWARISAGEVVSFRTYMTGELFALLAEKSVLRHSMGDRFEAEAFLEAVRDGMSDPQALAGRLFTLRAADLLGDPTQVSAKARLSGFLIGAELTAAKAYWLGQRVVVLGTGMLGQLYADALAGEGAMPEVIEAEGTTLAGLSAAYERAKESK